MRAVMFDRYGDESVLSVRDIAIPVPGPHEVQVKVLVASLNPVDFKLRGGMLKLFRRPRLPAITGKDFAGEITALGSDVKGFVVGQRVFGSVSTMQGNGACAEVVVTDADTIAATPASISDAVAACLPVASGTALQALVTIAQLRQGQSVLITGASGGVGSSGVQIARSVGAHITGVCSMVNVDYVRSIGADEVLDYRTTDWRRPGKIYDVIFDAAGVSGFGEARRYLAPTGYYINTFPGLGMLLTSKLATLFSGQHSVPFMLKNTVASLQALARLAEQGVLQPRIAETVGMEGVADAQRRMQEGSVHGKVCVRADAEVHSARE